LGLNYVRRGCGSGMIRGDQGKNRSNKTKKKPPKIKKV